MLWLRWSGWLWLFSPIFGVDAVLARLVFHHVQVEVGLDERCVVKRAEDVECSLATTSVGRHVCHALGSVLGHTLTLHIILAHVETAHHLQHVRCRHCCTFSQCLLLPQLKQLLLIIDHLHLGLLLHGYEVVGLALQNRKLLLKLAHLSDFLLILLLLLYKFLLLIIFFYSTFSKFFNLYFKQMVQLFEMLLDLGMLLLSQQIYLGELSNHLAVSFLLASKQLTSLFCFLVSDF